MQNDKINLIYTGEIFSKLRDLTPFVEALENFQKEKLSFLNRFNILFFGNIDDEILRDRINKISNVSFNERVDYKTALKYIIHGDGLLIWGNKNSKQIPAKIYDYFGTKNPIIAILGDENDPLKCKVINSKKCITISNNKEEIIKGLKELEYLIREKKYFSEDTKYEWRKIGEELNSILIFEN